MLNDNEKQLLKETFVGFVLGAILCAIISLLSGCKTTTHVEKEYVLKTDTVFTTITERITDTKVDTFYLTQVRVDTIWQTTTQTSTTQELWDNLILQWTDSLGRTYTQRHEKGSRTTTDSTSINTISILRDSLALYETTIETMQDDFDCLYGEYKALLQKTEEKNKESKTKFSLPSLPILLCSLALIALLVFIYIKLKR